MNEGTRATDGVRIWMPFYCADTLAESVRLTTRQFGAYIFLMIEYWLNGPLPNDDATLRQITRLERSEWKHDGPALKALTLVCFIVCLLLLTALGVPATAPHITAVHLLVKAQQTRSRPRHKTGCP